MDLRGLSNLVQLMGALDMMTEQTTRVAVTTSGPTSRRLQRFGEDYDGKWNVGGSALDLVSLIVDKSIKISALGLGNAMAVGDSATIESIEIRKTRSSRGKLIYRHPTGVRITNTGVESDKYVKINFRGEVKLKKHVVYTILVQYAAGNPVYASGGTKALAAGGVNFTFIKSACEEGDVDNNGNSETAGPIRDIYFS
jgi:hypothetical protein